MIIGIGTDIVAINRLQRGLDRFGDRFARRLLAENEYQRFLCSGNPVAYLAKRFAVKEAVAKAFGTGIGRYMGLQDIEVGNHDNGAPCVTLLGKALQLQHQRAVERIHVSLSDEHEYAVAFVILEGAVSSAP